MVKLAETGAEDPEYLDIVKAVQEENWNLDKENEIKKIKDHKSSLSITTLESGQKLIIKDDSEILVPKQARQGICNTLQFTHHSTEMMLKQANNKVYWPTIRSDLEQIYDACNDCKTNQRSKAQEHNEVSQTNFFDSYMPGQRILVDYAVNGTQNYILLVCALT